MKAFFLIAAGVIFIASIPAYILANLICRITHGSVKI